MDRHDGHVGKGNTHREVISIEQAIDETCKIVKKAPDDRASQVHPIEYLAWIFFLRCLEYQEQKAIPVKRRSEMPDLLFLETEYTWSAWTANALLSGSRDETTSFLNRKLLPRLREAFEIDIEKIPICSDFQAFKQILIIVDRVDLAQEVEGGSISYIYNRLLDTLAIDDKAKGHKKTGIFSTPFALVRFMVQLTNPQLGELIYDPACRTGNFFVESDRYIQIKNDGKPVTNIFQGYALHPLASQLTQMNMLLHNIDCSRVYKRDVLDPRTLFESYEDDDCPKLRAKVILTHARFGQRTQRPNQKAVIGREPAIEYYDRKLLEYCMQQLREDTQDRCAIVVSQNLLSNERNKDIELRRRLVTYYNILMIVRLPATTFNPFANYPTYLLYFQKAGETKKIMYCNIVEHTASKKKQRQSRERDFEQLLTAWQDWNRSPTEQVLQAEQGVQIWTMDSNNLHTPDSKYKLSSDLPLQDENTSGDLKGLLSQLLQNSLELYGITRQLQDLTHWEGSHL